MQIVDTHDQGRPVGHARQQLLQRRKRPPPLLLDVRRLDRPQARGGHRFHLAQHRKDLRQRRDVTRHQAFGFQRTKALQVPRQRVDQAIDGFVRHRFALITAPCEDDRLRVILAQASEEMGHQRALSNSRTAMDQHNHGLAPGGAIRRAQRLKLFRASYEWALRGRGYGPLHLKPGQHLSSRRPRAWVDLQQIVHELI